MHRHSQHSYNNLSFSLAWFKDNKWKTYYRKFNLNQRRDMIVGQYTHNLYFDEKLNIKGTKIMIYACPLETTFNEINTNFPNQKIVFQEIFDFTESDWKMICPNFKYFKQTYARLLGTNNITNRLQIKVYKRNEQIYMTLPKIQILTQNFKSSTIAAEVASNF